jgi:hypothetical protein
MMGTREILKGGGEYEALTRGGRRYVQLARGEVRRIKRQFWKRIRKTYRRRTWDEALEA